jgi:hypothetical protein
MKKVILSMVFMFAVTAFVNAAILNDRNCVEEAMTAGDKAEKGGDSYEDAYDAADLAYLRCESEK